MNDLTTPASFVHLHVHSDYSLLDGAAKVKALCRTAADQGAPAIALTDHGAMYGAMEFHKAAKDHGLVPIIGVEAYLAPRGRFDRTVRDEAHVTLLAQNEEGYRNLIGLVSAGFTEGYYYKPRIDLDLLAQRNSGIICLSGCLSGLVQTPLLAGNYEVAKAAAQTYREIFGDRFYLEIMRHGIVDQQRIDAAMQRLSSDLNVPLVATNDAHYLTHADHHSHDVLLCIGTAKTLADEKRFKFDGDQYFLKTPEQMRQTFADLPGACDATMEIAKRVDLQFAAPTFHIPNYPIPADKQVERDGSSVSPQRYLQKLCLGGLRKRYGTDRVDNDAALRERLDYELGVIEQMGFASYFLIVWDFIKYAREQDIPVGPGRGSAVGSLVSYCLGITSLDPLKYDLIFERFLNPSRISMPDIDTDFCIEGRDRVISYVIEKYGADRVAQIITFGTLASRAAVRDAGRVLGVPLKTVDMIAKMLPGGPNAPTVAQARAQIPEIARLENEFEDIRTLLQTAQGIEGFVRNAGTHAAGILISDKPITEYLPVCTQRSNGATGAIVNTQYEMGWVEDLGLLKMDFLGLRNLTVMREAERMIQRDTDSEFTLDTIPDNDLTTLSMLARGQTEGVFQMESPGMRRVLVQMAPDRFEDLVAAVALYRPGPMELIPQYIDVKHGRTKPTYLHPALEAILAPTYSVAVFQEQILQIAREIAGFSMSEADELRKIVGKKITSKIGDQRKKFIAGAVAKGIPESTAIAIFNFIAPFAGYGFNKCAHGSTEVQLPDGTRTTLSAAYKNQPDEIMAMWPHGQIRPHKVARIVRTGRKMLLHIRTASGKSIKVTPEHRLLTAEGYLKAQDMAIGTELITAPRRVTEKQRAARRASMTKLNCSATQRARVSQRVKAYQDARNPEDKRQHMLRMHKRYPHLTRHGAAAMHERIKWLYANDPAWRAEQIAKSIGSTRSCYDTGPGYGRCSVASNGMWCASQPERDMCEWLIEQQIPFEMHKVLATGRICDFYFNGIYWEMDGMDRSAAYFAEKYGDLPYVVVAPEDFKPIVLRHLGVAHAANGDPIVSIIPCGEAMTYDVEMAPDGPLNYVANRIVSHNSHAVAYAWISYQTAYLKAHHPLQYLASLLSSVADNADKLVEYLREADALHVPVMPPDVNLSGTRFSVVNDTVRMGFSAIKGITSDGVAAIIAEREANGPFDSLWNLVSRTRAAGLQKRTLEALIKVGACDTIPGHRSQKLAALDLAFDRANREIRDQAQGQSSLFAEIPDVQDTLTLPDVAECSRTDMLRWEYDGLGMYVSGHPADTAQATLRDRGALSIAQTLSVSEGRYATTGGVLRNVRRLTTKGGQLMLTAVLEDRTGSLDVVLFASQYEQWQSHFEDGEIVLLTGAVRLRQPRNENDTPTKSLHITQAERLLPAVEATASLSASA